MTKSTFNFVFKLFLILLQDILLDRHGFSMIAALHIMQEVCWTKLFVTDEPVRRLSYSPDMIHSAGQTKRSVQGNANNTTKHEAVHHA